MNIKKAIEKSDMNAINRMIRFGFNYDYYAIKYCIELGKYDLLCFFLEHFKDKLNTAKIEGYMFLAIQKEDITSLKILQQYYIHPSFYLTRKIIQCISIQFFESIISNFDESYYEKHLCTSALVEKRYDLLKYLIKYTNIDVLKYTDKYITCCIISSHVDFLDDIVIEIRDFLKCYNE